MFGQEMLVVEAQKRSVSIYHSPGAVSQMAKEGRAIRELPAVEHHEKPCYQSGVSLPTPRPLRSLKHGDGRGDFIQISGTFLNRVAALHRSRHCVGLEETVADEDEGWRDSTADIYLFGGGGGSVVKINDVVEGPKYDKCRVNEWVTDN